MKYQDTRKIFLAKRFVKPWNVLLKDVAKSPYLEMFNKWLDVALRATVYLIGWCLGKG